MMFEVKRQPKLQLLVLVFLLASLPTLVMGDVHFENENHACERVQHGIGSDLPWHPHEACDSEEEDSHSELNMSIQKNEHQTSMEDFAVVTFEPAHDHDECASASQTSKIYTPIGSDILTLNNTLLI